MNQTLIHQRVAEARDGTNPAVIARMRSGWAVVGDRQIVHGYCLLVPDPVVPHLNALTSEARGLFLQEMALLGDVLLEITHAARINYEMLGNLEPALHAHVIPRYRHEPEHLRTQHPWAYDWNAAPAFDAAASSALSKALRAELAALGTLRTP